MGKKLIRAELQNYISFADDEIVQSMYNLIKNNIQIPEVVINETLSISKNIKKGKEKTYSEKEFKALTKKYRNNERVVV
jgi:predicted nucleic acid-binding protein